MATRTTAFESRPGFYVDDASLDRIGGRQIDWAQVVDTDAVTGKKVILPGTIVAEKTGSKLVFPRKEIAGSEKAIGILETYAIEDEPTAPLSGYGIVVGGVVFENLLADFGDAAFATMKTELAAATTVTGFAYQTYADTRVTA